MENYDDKLITDFFLKNKKEISDNGFSKKVMLSLPEKKSTQWIVLVFSLIGFYISLLFMDVREIITNVFFFIAQINPVYSIACFIMLPFVCLFLWFTYVKKHPIFN